MSDLCYVITILISIFVYIHLWESFIFPHGFVLLFRIPLFQLAGFCLAFSSPSSPSPSSFSSPLPSPHRSNGEELLGIFHQEKYSFLHCWRTVLPDIVFGVDIICSFRTLNIVSHTLLPVRLSLKNSLRLVKELFCTWQVA